MIGNRIAAAATLAVLLGSVAATTAQVKPGRQPGTIPLPAVEAGQSQIRLLPPKETSPPAPLPRALSPGPRNRADQGPEARAERAEDVSPGVTLDELIAVAMGNNPAIRESLTQAAAARAKAYQASLYPNPVLATGAPQLTGGQSQYNIFASQDIVTKGKLRLDTAAASGTAREAEFSAVRTRFEVLTTVRQRFYTTLAAQRRADVLHELLEIARKSKDVGDRLLKGGVGTRTDVLLLDIELDRSVVSLQNADTMVDANRRQLIAALGVPNLAVSRLAGDLEAKTPAYDMIAVEQGVVSRNALARSAEVEIGRSQILLERARVEPFPNVNFLGGFQYQVNEPHQQGLYQVTMTVPLWNRNQGNIRAAEQSVGTAMAQLGRVRNDLSNQTAAAIGRYLSAQQSVDRYEQQILPKAQETQRITQNLYGEGELDFLRLLQAQRTLIEANLGYINAQEARWTAAAEVAGLLESEQFP